MWKEVELFILATFRQSDALTVVAVRSLEVHFGSTSVLICAKIENRLLTKSSKLSATNKTKIKRNLVPVE